MDYYNYLFNLICQRRLVTLSKVESVAFNVSVAFGLATGTFLVPVVVNTFYYFSSLSLSPFSLTGIPNFVLSTNSGQGSVGAITLICPTANGSNIAFRNIELDSFQYLVNNHSSGNVFLLGELFKITYTA